MINQFDNFLVQFNMSGKKPFKDVYLPQNQALLNIYTIVSANSRILNVNDQGIMKEYKVDLYQTQYLNILYRIQDDTDFKPAYRIEFTDNLIKEYFFFSLRKDTIRQKNYRSEKPVHDLLTVDLCLRTDLNKQEQENVITMRNIMTQMNTQFNQSLTNLNNEIDALKIQIDEDVFKLYKLTPNEITEIKNN